MQSSLAGAGITTAGVGRDPRDRVGSRDPSTSEAGGLDDHGLAHDGAAVSQDLQFGDGSAAGGGLGAGGRRHGAQGGDRGLLHEGAHGLGLA